MPRKARIVSATKIYHVMLRGVNQQLIFEDEEDFQYFITILSTCKEICGYKIFAYCLMSNHIHLLIEEGEEALAKIIKRICNRYVYWYNHKYDRIGHFFQRWIHAGTAGNGRKRRGNSGDTVRGISVTLKRPLLPLLESTTIRKQRNTIVPLKNTKREAVSRREFKGL